MKSLRKPFAGASLSVLGLVAAVFALCGVAAMRAANPQKKVGLPTDWSHKHLVFSAARDQAHMAKMEREPRFVQQGLRRGQANGKGFWHNPVHNENRHQMARDWSMLLGAGATVGAANFPAKFAFDLNNAECGDAATPDYVAFNTNLSGGSATAATGTVTINSQPADGDTITIGLVTYTWESLVGSCVGPCVISSPTTSTDAANLASAVNDVGCVGTTCVNILSANAAASASASGSAVTLTGLVLGAGGNFALSITGSAAVSVSGGSNGGDAQASVVAFDNLYSGCATGAKPTTYWAYNTSGTVDNSLTVSGDGTQVAFVQRTGAGSTNLVILKWVAGEGSGYNGTSVSPATPATSTSLASTYVACKSGGTSCMMSIPFSNSATDTNSNVFYDYSSDNLYVGDDSGAVHKFAGVFLGTPSEAGAPWPVTVNTTGQNPLTSAIFDSVSGLIFVADKRGGSADTNGGRLYAVDSTGTVAASAQLAGGSGFVESPVVDGGAGLVFMFAAEDNAGTNAAVFELATTLVAGSPGLEATVGSPSATLPLYAGDFDNDFYTFSGSGPGGTDHLYVCGNPAGTPRLYQIAINFPIMTPGPATAGPALASGAASCSPQTEIFNPNATGGAADWFFVSVINNGIVGNGCTGGGGCLMSFTLDDTAFVIPTTPTAALPAANGTSGVIVDNVVGSGTLTGASQVYFTPLGNQTCTTSGGSGGCAIQASQSGLQ